QCVREWCEAITVVRCYINLSVCNGPTNKSITKNGVYSSASWDSRFRSPGVSDWIIFFSGIGVDQRIGIGCEFHTADRIDLVVRRNHDELSTGGGHIRL